MEVTEESQNQRLISEGSGSKNSNERVTFPDVLQNDTEPVPSKPTAKLNLKGNNPDQAKEAFRSGKMKSTKSIKIKEQNLPVMKNESIQQKEATDE